MFSGLLSGRKCSLASCHVTNRVKSVVYLYFESQSQMLMPDVNLAFSSGNALRVNNFKNMACDKCSRLLTRQTKIVSDHPTFLRQRGKRERVIQVRPKRQHTILKHSNRGFQGRNTLMKWPPSRTSSSQNPQLKSTWSCRKSAIISRPGQTTSNYTPKQK